MTQKTELLEQFAEQSNIAQDVIDAANKKVFDVNALADLVKECAESKPKKWLVISPEGLLTIGTADQIAPLIMRSTTLLSEFDGRQD